MSVSINNPRNQERTGFTSFELAEKWKNKRVSAERKRIKKEQKDGTWNGNEFVFWIDRINTEVE